MSLPDLNFLLISNILGLLSSVFLVLSGLFKSKRTILFAQIVQIGLATAGQILVGGISGAMTNIVSIARNIFAYKGKIKTPHKIIFSIFTVALPLIFEEINFFFFLPIISSLAYIWFMTVDDIIKFKFLLAGTNFLWFIYDTSIQMYTCAIPDLISVTLTLVSIYMTIKSNKKNSLTKTTDQIETESNEYDSKE